ncbi:MAG: malto-oligosyltrehalose trehalohydrolase [Candidatus Protochlamydia sp.]|nr:malto-oligosyltrehalose trehalohydrolase [Candidatus Protochlamydia sp.]
MKRRFPIGAELIDHSAHFRVWAPEVTSLGVVLESSAQFYPLQNEKNGYFSGSVAEAKEGSLYRFKLNEDEKLYPDPTSRYQPLGPKGPSQVIDPFKFNWTDQAWKGAPLENRIIYEMHIGTFTIEGTWDRAKRELLELADLGITVIEMMPVNEFPGKYGWGYDGVYLFAPTHLYGEPNDLKDFINHAHALGIAVILDVVYNHFGPTENYFKNFSKDYFSVIHTTEWGDTVNFDGQNSGPVREFFITNALYWIDEYHFDGFRFDATQNIYDFSSYHILTEISQKVRQMAPNKNFYFIAENEAQLTKHVDAVEKGGYGLDALLNDDFHHSTIVRLTGRKEGYNADYSGSGQEYVSMLKYGYLFQGQWSSWKFMPRGTPGFHLDPSCFVNFFQNHDQIANFAFGLRLHQLSGHDIYRAITALLLLAPATPLIFQGQEFAASTPFFYFADYPPNIAEMIEEGRKTYFKRFASYGTSEIQALLQKPSLMETFLNSKLILTERESHHQAYNLHKDLLKLRKNDPIFNAPKKTSIDGIVLNQDAFIVRYFGEENDTRLLVVNFGIDLVLTPANDPLLAPPEGTDWTILWSSESPRYGGNGVPPLSTDHHWSILGHAANVLIPKPLGK